MDDDRIERALREGPPDEPSYRPAVGRLLAAEAEPTTGRADGPFDSGVARPRAQVRGQSLGLSRWSAAIAAVLVVIVAGFALRLSGVGTSTPTPSDLLSQIRASGVIRIAVSNEAPQVQGAGGAYVGFDVDVANAIATKLGVRAEIVPVPPSDILAGSGTWDIAFPSTDPGDATGAFVDGPAYYAWPSWLVVPADAAASSIDDLAGQFVCVSGSAGGVWLTGSPVPHARALTPPEVTSALLHPDDAACFAAVAAGEAAAAVTSTTLDTELVTAGVRTLLAEPVIVQDRLVLVRDLGPGGDASSLEAAVDAAVADLRASGELPELSRRAFGGRDLTEVLQ